jgi:hypothetical protein
MGGLQRKIYGCLEHTQHFTIIQICVFSLDVIFSSLTINWICNHAMWLLWRASCYVCIFIKQLIRSPHDDGHMTETRCGNKSKGREEELLRWRTINCFMHYAHFDCPDTFWDFPVVPLIALNCLNFSILCEVMLVNTVWYNGENVALP